ncbi:MAG TPA: long-chain-fatty-acid--CoA ligase [Mycobacteriales bacterium]|jgi:acyl-CoA synthetase (AMP-forming)/AMP-acid ligase II|nr:long-chain-fatty-acid--CoA ligase [Mycobacteriales bacterium]
MTNDAELAGLRTARRMSHGEQLARMARRRPDHVAFRFEGIDRTFGELDERVTRLANALADRGAQPGDRVAVLMTNRLEVVESYLACARLGAVCVPVNFRLVADEVAYILEDSGSVALIVDAGLAELAAKVRPPLKALRATIVTGGAADAAGAGAEDYETVLAAASAEPPMIDVEEHAPAFIMYTSGTTGRPKGAVLSHFNLYMNTYNLMVTEGIFGEDEVWLSGLPLFHIGGLNGILPYLLLGGTSVILPSGQFDAAEVVDIFEREKITGCYFVPTQWQQICAVPGIGDRQLHLRRISWGASVAPPSVLQAMADTFPGVPNYNAFGQTEMSSVTCVLLGEDAVRKMGSVGTPVMNVEVRIVDDEMKDCGVDEIGEIVYRGPTVMQGYWNKPEATEEAFRGGWFHSGDLVRRDAEGYIYVVDRKKDMIISGGENIYSAEVEAAIDAHPGVREVAVIGIAHERWVETPCAIIVPVDPANPPSQQDIIDWCKDRLASYKKPTKVVVTEVLPRNASGKVLKTRLRESYAAS